MNISPVSGLNLYIMLIWCGHIRGFGLGVCLLYHIQALKKDRLVRWGVLIFAPWPPQNNNLEPSERQMDALGASAAPNL